jgi:hypothetical protein
MALAIGSKTCATSSVPAATAAAFSAMLRSVTRATVSGSSPARRMSSCRHHQGVGTSLTEPSVIVARSVSRKPGRSPRPIRKTDRP